MSDEILIGETGGPILTLLSASAVRQALTSCAEAFHAEGGSSVRMLFDTSGGILKRIDAGETTDLVASSLDALSELHGRGSLPAAAFPVGSARIALGIRAGEVAPDISTVGKFRAAMLAATRISRGDPAGGGTAGNYLASLFERLDLLTATADRTVLRVGGYKVMQEVAEHRADFGLTQSTEIAAVAGVEIGAWLPPEIQLTTSYGVGATAAGAISAQARAFLDFIGGAQGRAIFARAGFFADA